MPRGPRSIRNPQYSAGGGGGGGGGLGKSLIGALFGAPPMIQGGDVTGQVDPAVDLGSSDKPVMEPYTVSKPNFFSKLSGGNQQYAGLNNTLKLGEIQNLQAKDLAAAHGKAQLDLETLRSSNDVVEKQKAAALKAQEDRALEEAALNKLAAEKGFGSWANYKQILDNPDMMTAGVKGMYSDREKQGFDNAATQAKTAEILQGDIPYKQAQTDEIRAGIPTKRFLTLPPGNAGVDPVTGQVINNIKPEKEVPDFKGGVVSSSLPSYSGGSFAKVPGGVNSEFVSRGIPPMLARPGLANNQVSNLPRFQMPEQPLNPEIQNLPPSYQEYFKNSQPETPDNPPITPQRAVPISGGTGPYPQPVDPQSAILNFLRRSRVGMPQQFNPYAIQ